MISSNNSDLILQKLLKEGKYYEVAFSHYYNKYAVASNHRVWLIITLSYVLTLIAVVMFNIYSMFPLRVKIPFVRYTSTMYEEMFYMKGIPDVLGVIYDKRDSVQFLIYKFMIKNYVFMKEGVSGIDNEYRNLYIKNNSSYKIYSDHYRSYTKSGSSTNVNSVYDLKITDIKIIEDDSLLKFASASFTAIDVDGNLMFRRNVKIGFRISDVFLAYKGLVPLEFVVVSYEKI